MNRYSARLAAILLLLAVPLASGWLAGFPAGFTELPPLTVSRHPPGYSSLLYACFTVALVGVAVFLAAPGWFGFEGTGQSDLAAFEWAAAPRSSGSFPRHGWAGAALIAVSWAAAWSRPEWLGWIADHTFFPLWLGYVLTVDAITYRRAGTSPLARSPLTWLAWFPASAAFWWYFELLNRFTESWVYLHVAHFSPLRYVTGATLAFSTVIPAVLTTAALLSTVGWFRHRYIRTGARCRTVPPSRASWWWLVAVGVLGLALMPWFPVALFPVIWIAPVLIVAGLLELAGKDTSLGHLLRGDWGPAVTLAVSALFCGFFWELWNLYAMPKWIYQIPWLNRFEMFEMPLVGYLGYLPFGPTCWAFWLLLSPDRDGVRRRGTDSQTGLRRGSTMFTTPPRRPASGPGRS